MKLVLLTSYLSFRCHRHVRWLAARGSCEGFASRTHSGLCHRRTVQADEKWRQVGVVCLLLLPFLFKLLLGRSSAFPAASQATLPISHVLCARAYQLGLALIISIGRVTPNRKSPLGRASWTKAGNPWRIPRWDRGVPVRNEDKPSRRARFVTLL